MCRISRKSSVEERCDAFSPSLWFNSTICYSMRITRRELWAAAGFGTGCTSRTAKHTLTVFVWSGPWSQTMERSLKPRFEKATGANLQIENGWGQETAKLLISPPDQPPFDVMIFAPFAVYGLIRRNYFQKLDFGK